MLAASPDLSSDSGVAGSFFFTSLLWFSWEGMVFGGVRSLKRCYTIFQLII